MGLISRVSSRTYSKTGELGEEHFVYNLTQSAKARKRITSFSKSPTSPSCYHFQTKSSQKINYYSSTNSPVRYKNHSLRKHHSLSKIKLSYEKTTTEERKSIESQQHISSSPQKYTKISLSNSFEHTA